MKVYFAPHCISTEPLRYSDTLTVYPQSHSDLGLCRPAFHAHAPNYLLTCGLIGTHRSLPLTKVTLPLLSISDRDAVLSGLLQYSHRYTTQGMYLNILCTVHVVKFNISNQLVSRSQWPRGLRRRSTAARLLRSWFRIPPGEWMSVCCECCVLSGSSLRQADHSSRGVLPTAVRRCVCYRNPIYEEPNINQ